MRYKARRAAAALLFLIGAALLLPVSASALIETGTPWPDGRVPVCWRSDADDHDYFTANAPIVRDAVENQWGRVANLTFVGWGICAGAALNEPGGTVVIHWEDDDINKGSRADIGYRGSTRTFVRLVPMSSTKTETQFRSDALHEFGHALGFGHEQNHPQRNGAAPGVCQEPANPNATVLTPFDVTSIMAWTYCGLPATGAISPWDVVGVQRLYDRKQPGAIVGQGNSCLDIPNASLGIGTDLQVFNCHADPNQRWDFTSQHSLRATLGDQTRCVGPAGTTVSPTSGTQLESLACDGSSREVFTFSDVELRGVGEKCVDVPGGNYALGQSVQLFDCQDSANQHWSVNGSTIKSTASNYCLDVPGGTAVNNKLLQLAPCTNGASQQFSLTDAGQIKFGSLCVDSQTGSPVDGAKLQLFTCKSDAYDMRNQQWHLTGAIHGLGGQCLDIKGGQGVDRAKVQLYPCTGNANQRWDYYFD